MKPDAREAARLLANPTPRVRAILLHGDDHGLIRERAGEAIRAVAGTLDDPFRLAVLGRDEHDRLAEEATALSLSGGRRVVWVRDGQDALHASVASLLQQPGEALIVIESAALPGRSKLRTLLEAAPEAAAIACYAEEGRALEASIARMLQAEQIRIDPDALTWLARHLGADRTATRGEVEKLALYAGERGTISLDDVQAVVGDAAAASLEDAAFAATAGDHAAADLAIERALTEGLSPIALARALLSHLHRLRQVALLTQAGTPQSDAIARLRPPVFFKRRAEFTRALSLWSPEALSEAATATDRLERACKRTGAPDLVLARHHVVVLAQRAAGRSSRA
ncbi:DNA polymerase III subunit delta [Lichenicoccus sp.]|uniref:DNA polymerase III subunit delta n=1 Tax=Lichenicoccus sp. TaxID=2781899 RepID=UPI003D0A64FE